MGSLFERGVFEIIILNLKMGKSWINRAGPKFCDKCPEKEEEAETGKTHRRRACRRRRQKLESRLHKGNDTWSPHDKEEAGQVLHLEPSQGDYTCQRLNSGLKPSRIASEYSALILT